MYIYVYSPSSNYRKHRHIYPYCYTYLLRDRSIYKKIREQFREKRKEKERESSLLIYSTLHMYERRERNIHRQDDRIPVFRQLNPIIFAREYSRPLHGEFSNAEYKAACTAYVQWTHLCSGQRPAWPRPPGGDKRTAWARIRCRMSVRHYRKPARTVCPMDKTTDKRSAGHRSPNIGRPNSIPARCKTSVSAVSCRLQAHWTNPIKPIDANYWIPHYRDLYEVILADGMGRGYVCVYVYISSNRRGGFIRKRLVIPE